MYTIQKHYLTGDGYEQLTTKKMGATLDPRFLLIHYTSGASYEADLRTLSTDPVSASVHLVIGRNGEMTQIVPFNRVAWHAGESHWQGLNGMNRYSIGIELSNAGLLKKDQAGAYRSWWGATIPNDEVYEAAHPRGGAVVGWHMFPMPQIEKLFTLATVLYQRYGFLDILGHDDVSWPRKTDPGPAFPMGSLRSRVLGRQ